jgi:hypothetical protein
MDAQHRGKTRLRDFQSQADFNIGGPTKMPDSKNHMLDSLMMRAGVMFLIVGMVWGIEMGIRQEFSLAPAHAHWNLIGGVLLFVFGLYYRMVPAARESALAKWQASLHFVGAILFPLGVAVVIKKGAGLIVLPIIGSLVVVLAVTLFAVIVFRTSRA